MFNLNSPQFAQAWFAELSQEFIDTANQKGSDMVYVFNHFSANQQGLNQFLQLVEDQAIDPQDLISDFDPETNIFSMEWAAVDFELINA